MNIRSVALIISYCLLSVIIDAQPLQFLDIATDSNAITQTHVNTTADGGWIMTSVIKDTSIQLIKFDYCGVQQWNQQLKSDGQIKSSSAVIHDDVYYFVAVYSDSIRKGLYTFKCSNLGKIDSANWMTFRDMNFYSNPKYLFYKNDVYLTLNVGNDNDRSRFTFVKFDQNMKAISAKRLKTEKLMHDAAIGEDGSIYATMNQTEFLKFDDAGNTKFTRRYHTRYEDFGDNILIDGSNIYLAGFTIRDFFFTHDMKVIRIDDQGEYKTQSVQLPYDNRIKVNGIIEKGQLFYLYADTGNLRGNKIMVGTNFDAQLNYRGATANNIKNKSKALVSCDITYLTEEKNIVIAGASRDSMKSFHAKLSGMMENACGDSLIVSFMPKDTTTHTDTLINDKWDDFILPNAINARDTAASQKPKFYRACEKFEFKPGENKLPDDCKGKTVQVGVKDYPNAKYKWSNGATGSSTSIVVPGQVMLNITYCDKSIDMTFKVEELKPIVPSTFDYGEFCVGKDTSFKAEFQPHYSAKLEWQKDKSTNIILGGVKVILGELNEKVIISYCKDVPGSSEIKFEQSHIIKSGNQSVNLKFPNVVSSSSDVTANKVFKHIADPNEESKVDEYSLVIYNRWGKKVYETNKLSDSWNLMYKGEPAPIDTYIYIVEAKGKQCYENSFKGDFTIIR